MMRNSGELVLIDFGTAREETQTYYQKNAGATVNGYRIHWLYPQ